VGYIRTRHFRFAILVVSTGLVVAYCIRHTADLRILLRLSIADIAVLVLLAVTANVIMAYKVFILLRRLGLRGMTFLEWMRLFAVSRFANFYITQGANLYRAVKLKRDHAFSYSHSVGITGVITCFDAAAILSVAALLVLIGRRFQSPAGYVMLGAAVLLVGMLAGFPSLAQAVRRLLAGPGGKWWGWAADRLGATAAVFAGCTRDARTIAFLTGTTVLVYLVYVLGAYVCLTAFGQDVSLFDAALLAAVYVLSQTVKVVPGNVGISELLTGLSTGVLMDEMLYGVTVAAIFRVVDVAVIGSASLVLTVGQFVRRGREPELGPPSS